MFDDYKINGTRFLGWWAMASLAVWPMSVIVAIPGGIVLSMIMPAIMYESSDYSYYNSLPYFFSQGLLAAYVGAMIGFSVGYLQKSLLTRFMFIEIDGYKWRTTFAGALAGPLVWILYENFYHRFGYSFDYYLYGFDYGGMALVHDLIPMTLFTVCLSIAQYFVLRRFVNHAWLWVLANGIAGFVFSMIVSRDVARDSFTTALMAALAQGLITGGTMRWLFDKLIRDDLVTDALPVYEPTLWDEAVD